jgi:phage protein D
VDVNVNPAYSLTANDQDITAIIVDRFVSLRLVDESGDNADSLEIVLANHDPAKRIKRPPTGAELALSLGYDGKLVKKGIFVCDGVRLSGFPDRMTIRAKAAPWDETPKGKTDFQSHKTRAWKVGTTIGAMVQKMAQEHGMEARVASELASIKLPHVDQSEESDMNLLLRLAKKYDAIAKPAGGKLIFTKRGAATNVSGAALPKIAVTADQCGAYEMDQTTRESAGTVVAYYHAKRTAKRHEVTAGTGEPVKRLKQYFTTAEMALAAAKAELARRARGEFKLSINVPGDPQITAECLLDLSGFLDDDVNGEWLVKRAEHALSKGQAYRCIIDCERPNSDADVAAVMSGTTADSAAE